MAFPGCNSDNGTEPQPTIERIRQNGVLLVGTTGDYHPLTFLEPDGTYTGFGIEMAEAIAKEHCVGIKFVPTSWPTLTADVLENPQKFDLAIGGITITDKRLETMLMSEGYLTNGKTILCRRTDADKYKSLEDIDKPFTNGYIGVLMRKGQDDLLNAVNNIIERMKADGTLKKLHEKYGLVYSF